ncbi:MAG: hypothetical protein ACHQD8_07300 [Chitinophagales bacterium]
MHKTYLNTAIALILIFTVSCSSNKHSKSKRLPGTWQAQPITIDGNNKDWSSPYPEYDDKAMLGYAVSNDKDNLYITVETGDPATQLKILREGLTVWIDKTANKDEITAINFPIPQPGSKENRQEGSKPASGHIQQGQGGGSQDKRRFELEDRVKKALSEANEYSLQGFKSCNLQYPVMEKDSCGIVVRIGLDADNELVWEAVIPFKSFYYKPHIGISDKGKPLSICFETTGIKRPAGQSNGPHGGGGGMRPGMSMGMGGMGMGMRMGGGGMRGGGNRGSQNNNNDLMESLYKSTKTYKKFGIAFQQ